jgi:membrane protease YdiL (CAAX protease family)
MDTGTGTSHLRGVVVFVLVTVGVTWAMWSLLWVPGVPENQFTLIPLLLAGMWMPGLAAILVTRFVLKERLRTLTLGRLGPWRYYVWAWALPIAGTFAALLLTAAFGMAEFDSRLSRLATLMEESGKGDPGVPLWVIVVAQGAIAVTLAPLINIVFAVGEEIGWRGFLLPRLMGAGMRQWQALLTSGVIWGLWHAPVILHGHNYPEHPYLGVLLMTVFCVLLGVVFGWLQLASGSVWVPALAHGSLNAIAGLPILLLTKHDGAFGGTLASVVGWFPIAAFVAWLYWTRRLPVTKESQRTATA